MSDAQTATAPATAPATDTRTAAIAQLAAGGLFDDMPEAPAAAANQQAAPANTTPVVASEADPLDDSLFSDEKPWTPERIKELKAAIVAEKAKANELRKKAHNAHAQAEAREAKFKKTKETTLSEKKAIQGQAALLNGELAAIRSGDPDAFLKAVARLSGSPDPDKFWRDAVTLLASGGKLREDAASRPDPALKQELDQIKQYLQQQHLDATQQVEAQKEAEILRLRAAQVEFAQQATATHPIVASIAQSNPVGIDEALMKIKIEEHKRTGSPIDNAAACALLETELRAQYELIQRANGSSGSANGERGSAVSGTDSEREIGARAKPGMPQSQASQTQHSTTTVPASLSASSGATRRPASKREQTAAIAAALPPSFWNNFGLE